MNGSEQKIFDAIQSIDLKLVLIETKQEERHVQNQKDIDKLHKTITNVVTLKTQVYIQWWFIGVITMATMGMAWRSFK